MEELWKPVVGYEGKYMVSNFGNVMSLGGVRGSEPMKLLKQQRTTNGYKKVCLGNGGSGKKPSQVGVHRIVATAFVPNPENKEQVNHKDGDKTNNHVENLEWVTRSENALHAYRNLPMKERNHFHAVKLTEQQVLEIFVKDGTYAQIGRDYGISPTMVKAIKTRKSWKETTKCLSTR